MFTSAHDFRFADEFVGEIEVHIAGVVKRGDVGVVGQQSLMSRPNPKIFQGGARRNDFLFQIESKNREIRHGLAKLHGAGFQTSPDGAKQVRSCKGLGNEPPSRVKLDQWIGTPRHQKDFDILPYRGDLPGELNAVNVATQAYVRNQELYRPPVFSRDFQGSTGLIRFEHAFVAKSIESRMHNSSHTVLVVNDQNASCSFHALLHFCAQESR